MPALNLRRWLFPWTHSQRPEALLPPARLALARATREHPYLGATTLNLRFASTWGFTVAFTRSGWSRLGRALPDFQPYFDLVLDRSCNAFFFNPLVVFQGGSVHAHVDCSLRTYTRPLEPDPPHKVSVFYAQVPPHGEGGALVIARPGKELARVQPVPGLLVEFAGHLLHHVTPFRAPTSELNDARISLVCEQYRLPPGLLARIPEFVVDTTRTFEELFGRGLQEAGTSGESRTEES